MDQQVQDVAWTLSCENSRVPKDLIAFEMIFFDIVVVGIEVETGV